MKKKTFFSLVTVVLAILLTIGITSHFTSHRYSKIEPTGKVLLEENSLKPPTNQLLIIAFDFFNSLTLEKSFQMFEKSFNEMQLQPSGINLLYCPDFDMPIVRTVFKENWRLIDEAVLINSSDQKDLKIITLQPLSVYWKITSFYYSYTNLSFSKAAEPPSNNWVELLPDENGSYQLPLNPQKTENEYRYTAIKYTAANQEFYGLISIK